MRRFFNAETGIWRFFGWAGDIAVLSLLWAVCSVPVITLGTSSTALYDTVVHYMRQKESGLLSRFFGTFRRELKPAILTTLLWAAVCGLLVLGYRELVTAGADGQVATPVSIVFLLLWFLIFCVLCWVFPLLSRFTFGFAALNATALRFAFGNILRSAAMALLCFAALALCARNFFFVFFAPGLVAWVSGFLIEPVFEKYV